MKYKEKESKFLDICFLMDATGSMWKYNKVISNSLRPLARSLTDASVNFRISVIVYRDYKPQDFTFVTKRIDFTENIKKLSRFLSRIKSQGGGDGPEALEKAINDCLELKWGEKSNKLCFIITDAPPHGIGESTDEIPKPKFRIDRLIEEKIKQMGIKFFVFGIEPAIFEYEHAVDYYINFCDKLGGFYNGIDVSEFDLTEFITEIIEKEIDTSIISIDYSEIMRSYYKFDDIYIRTFDYFNYFLRKIILKRAIKKLSQENDISSNISLGSRYRDLARNLLSKFNTYQNINEKLYWRCISYYISAITIFKESHKINNDINSLIQTANCARDIARLLYKISDNILYNESQAKIRNLVLNLFDDFDIKINQIKFNIRKVSLYKLFYLLSIELYYKSEKFILASLISLELFSETNQTDNYLLKKTIFLCRKSIDNEITNYKKLWLTHYLNRLLAINFSLKNKTISKKENERILNEILQNYIKVFSNMPKMKNSLYQKVYFFIFYIMTYKSLNGENIENSLTKLLLEKNEIYNNDYSEYLILNYITRLYKHKNLNEFNKSLDDIYTKMDDAVEFQEKYDNKKSLDVLDIGSHNSYYSSINRMLRLIYLLIRYNKTDEEKIKSEIIKNINVFNNHKLFDPVNDDLVKNKNLSNIYNPLWFLYTLNYDVNLAFQKDLLKINYRRISEEKLIIIVRNLPMGCQELKFYLKIKSKNGTLILNEIITENFEKSSFVQQDYITLDFNEIKALPNKFKIVASLFITNKDNVKIIVAKDFLNCIYNVRINNILRIILSLFKGFFHINIPGGK